MFFFKCITKIRIEEKLSIPYWNDPVLAQYTNQMLASLVKFLQQSGLQIPWATARLYNNKVIHLLASQLSQ